MNRKYCNMIIAIVPMRAMHQAELVDSLATLHAPPQWSKQVLAGSSFIKRNSGRDYMY